MELKSLLDRLITVVPPLIERGFPRILVPRRCVLATRVGLEVLRHFGFSPDATVTDIVLPVPVKVWAANAAFFRFKPLIEKKKATIEQAVAAGAKLVEVDTDGETPQGGYPGHLVLGVPSLGVIVDLDIGQFSRPQAKLVLPQEGAILHVRPGWWKGADPALYELEEGAKIAYEPLPDATTFRQAPDWKKPERWTRFVRRAIREIEEKAP